MTTAIKKHAGDGAAVSHAMTPAAGAEALEALIAEGDLARLRPDQRVAYYRHVCESVGLNPFTRPFEYIRLSGKLTLYARKDATDQLRRQQRVSITKVEKEYDEEAGLYTVTAYAQTADGRADVDLGVVPVSKGTKGEALANARMKAMTKAKRRVTLSVCGLGWLDESELDTIPEGPIGSGRGREAVAVDHETGEIVQRSASFPGESAYNPNVLEMEEHVEAEPVEDAGDPAQLSLEDRERSADARSPAGYKARAKKIRNALIALPAERIEDALAKSRAEVEGWPEQLRAGGLGYLDQAEAKRNELAEQIEHLRTNARARFQEGVEADELRAAVEEHVAKWPAWWQDRARTAFDAAIAPETTEAADAIRQGRTAIAKKAQMEA